MPETPRWLSDDARIDLHTHSRCSDGTTTVAELVRRAAESGLDAIALTDHDTVAGWDEAARAARAHGIAVVPGIEVSTEYRHFSVHVLAILPDPSAGTALAEELSRARASRDGRARAMVERLGADYPITWEDVAAQVAGENTTVGRPHIADALVACGVVPDRSAAFGEVLSPQGPYYVRHYAPAPDVAVRAIADAGGVSIAAHPASGMRGGQVPDGLLESMIASGLGGIEVDHREHDDVARARLRDLTRASDLIVTGGSDYHGAGKPNALGENLTAPAALSALIERAASRTEVLLP
ncbi:PHP domain-containing protein [Brachybacterium sp. JHP9]|uniref:PHP domain-containing protein n=1 Tax=Brachybacterium equifaecis TaxID=2910770 RepID=A0ABT0QWE7_9MICO|nr:PHP domain-containing protein [Brachybacterium equifaecis]MCL6421995.1 PHP domain-containing protein [Brachybacterium equifaecis]